MKHLILAAATMAAVIVPTAAVEAQSFTFTYDELVVVADGASLQTFDLQLPDPGQAVAEARFIINRPSHAQNGRSYSGYFLATRTSCKEVTKSYGNAQVALQTRSCTYGWSGGVARFTLAFEIDPGFGSATNNQVSVIWYGLDGKVMSGWKRATASGMGFDVESPLPQRFPATLVDFALGQKVIYPVALHQTVAVTFDHPEHINKLLVIVNHPSHVQNGRGYSGYFSMTPEGCKEVTGGYGNDLVELDTASCRVDIDEQMGVATWSLRFNLTPAFGYATNNQVSILWYEDGLAATAWRRATESGNGFDVSPYIAPVPVAAGTSYRTVSASSPDPAERTQYVGVYVRNPAGVTEVRAIINHPNHAINGRTYSGYIRYAAGSCALYPTATWKGNVNIEPAQCYFVDHGDGYGTFMLGWVHKPGSDAVNANIVSYLVYDYRGAIGGWRKEYTGGYDVQ